MKAIVSPAHPSSRNVVQIHYPYDTILQLVKNQIKLNGNHPALSFSAEGEGATLARPFRDLGLGFTLDASGRPIDYSREGVMAAGSMEQVETIMAWHLWHRGIAWHRALKMVRECIAAVESEFDETRPVSPLPGLPAFLAGLASRNLRLAVVTSDTTANARRHLEWLGIADAFSVVIGRDEVANGKPETDMVDMACRHLGIRASDTLLIGDSDVDMEMGRRAGVRLCVQVGQDVEAVGASRGLDAVDAAYVARKGAGPWRVRDYRDLLDDLA